MKIDNIGAGKMVEFYKLNKNPKDIKSNAPNFKDVIEISDKGKYLSIFSGSESMEKAGTKRVNEIKKEVAEGSYRVDSNVLANKIVDYIKGREV